MTTAVTDKWGRSMVLYDVLTICPVEHAAEARQIAAQFLDAPAELMLHDNLQKSGVSYVGCLRQAWSDELSRQSAFMVSRNLSWVDGVIRQPSEGLSSKFAMYAVRADASGNILAALGLEVV